MSFKKDQRDALYFTMFWHSPYDYIGHVWPKIYYFVKNKIIKIHVEFLQISKIFHSILFWKLWETITNKSSRSCLSKLQPPRPGVNKESAKNCSTRFFLSTKCRWLKFLQVFFSPKSSQIEPAEVTKLMGDVLIKIDYFQFRTKMHLCSFEMSAESVKHGFLKRNVKYVLT